MLKEFGSTFPEFKKVLIDERDMYLTNSLRESYQPIPNEFLPGGNYYFRQRFGFEQLFKKNLTKKKGFSPAKVVGVVGLGHIGGIKENWTKDFNIDHLK